MSKELEELRLAQNDLCNKYQSMKDTLEAHIKDDKEMHKVLVEGQSKLSTKVTYIIGIVAGIELVAKFLGH